MQDTQHFKNLLQKEVELLEKELATVGRKNPENASDWEATEKDDIDTAEDAEVASSMETFENNQGILEQLEKQLNLVKSALAKIEDGTYGKCENCGQDIENDRLEVNPSATTCKAHMS
ncbi:MAG: TraR/DksA C4-type zinc finger protein [Parcubacteria group bacterium]